MPCTYTGSIEGDRISDAETQITNLEQNLDEVTACLCKFSRELYKRDSNLWNIILIANVDLKKLILNHMEQDKERFYKFYKDIHSKFTKDEIYKMVINGILEEV